MLKETHGTTEGTEAREAGCKAHLAPNSILVLNVHLSLSSALLSLIQVIYLPMQATHGNLTPYQHSQVRVFDRDLAKGLFHDFNSYAWILVLLQAVGGLITAYVLKHTDNIVKVRFPAPANFVRYDWRLTLHGNRRAFRSQYPSY